MQRGVPNLKGCTGGFFLFSCSRNASLTKGWGAPTRHVARPGCSEPSENSIACLVQMLLSLESKALRRVTRRGGVSQIRKRNTFFQKCGWCSASEQERYGAPRGASGCPRPEGQQYFQMAGNVGFARLGATRTRHVARRTPHVERRSARLS